MRLYDLVDPYKLEEHINERRVGVQQHPTLPLLIYNYTHLAQFDPHWGDGTIDYCRGLIVANGGGRDYEIIARPFKKFHNLNTPSVPETLEENLPRVIPTVTRKYDGSLGIYYSFDGNEAIATRGSFTSDQAQWATNFLREYHPRGLFVPSGFTPLFEIIFNENRIVVQYDFEDIVLIGAVNNETGEESSPRDLRFMGRVAGVRVVEEVFATMDELKTANKNNEEGYVLNYEVPGKSPVKAKVKMADYVRLHRVVTGMNARSVWERLKANDDMKIFETGYPKPFVMWLNLWIIKLRLDFKNIIDDACDLFQKGPTQEPAESPRDFRKRCAAYVTSQPRQDLKGLYFMMLDGKSITEATWDLIEPAGNDKTFREEGE